MIEILMKFDSIENVYLIIKPKDFPNTSLKNPFEKEEK